MHTRTTSQAVLAVGAAALLAITGCTKEGEPEPESAAVLEAEQANYPVPGGEPEDPVTVDESDTDTPESDTAEDGEEDSPAIEPHATGPNAEWADEKISTWLDVEGVQSTTELIDQFNEIETWEAPSEGELVINVDPAITENDTVYQQDAGPANDLQQIGAVMMYMTYCLSPDLDEITTRTTDGERVETITREDHEAVMDGYSPGPGC